MKKKHKKKLEKVKYGYVKIERPSASNWPCFSIINSINKDGTLNFTCSNVHHNHEGEVIQ